MEKQKAEKARVEAEREQARKVAQEKEKQMDFFTSFLKRYVRTTDRGGYDYITINPQYLTGKCKYEVTDNTYTFLLKDKTSLPPMEFVKEIRIDESYNDNCGSTAFITEDGKAFFMMIKRYHCKNELYLLVIRDSDIMRIYEVSSSTNARLRWLLSM